MKFWKFAGIFIALLLTVYAVYDVFFFEPRPYTVEEARVEARESLAHYCTTRSQMQDGEELDCSIFGPPDIRIEQDGSAFVFFPLKDAAPEYGVHVYLGASGAYNLSFNLPFTTWPISERKKKG